MKCWRCGMDILDGTSVCSYCGVTMDRKSMTTEAGKAMRQIYDRFGCKMVFEKKNLLVTALGDMLEDSRKLRTQVDMAMSSGIGGVYLSQLQKTGNPDAAFYAKIRKLMTEDAGLSDKVTTELMGYFDEMIGWNGTLQSTARVAPTGGAASGSSYTPGRNPGSVSKEIPRGTQGGATPPKPPVSPSSTRPPVSSKPAASQPARATKQRLIPKGRLSTALTWSLRIAALVSLFGIVYSLYDDKPVLAIVGFIFMWLCLQVLKVL